METVRYTAKLSLQENLLWGVSLNLSFLRFIVIFLSKPCSLTPTLTEFLNMAVVLKPDNSCPVHNEIILAVSLKRLVKPERLRLDSTQHRPGAEKRRTVSSGWYPLGSTFIRPTHGARPSRG